MIRYMAMPDSSDSNYEEDMQQVAAAWESEKRWRPGVRGLQQEEEEREAEIRAEKARAACIRYLHLGDYWLEDWAAESCVGRQGARVRGGGQGRGESRASALTRSASSSVVSGDFAAAESQLEEALKADKHFCPALNNLGALFAHYADANRSAVETCRGGVAQQGSVPESSLDPAARPHDGGAAKSDPAHSTQCTLAELLSRGQAQGTQGGRTPCVQAPLVQELSRSVSREAHSGKGVPGAGLRCCCAMLQEAFGRRWAHYSAAASQSHHALKL